ncbi:restriction endonuclease [Pasteurellaceae bacterium LFhippo2]|nr:restriction endonuclease [Pasteurellaceae bacterium LFhippo2]
MRLSEVAIVQTGYLFRTKVPEDPMGNVSVVQMKDCSLLGEVDWQSCVKTTLTKVKESDWLKQGDILVASRGNNYNAIFIDETIENRQAVASPHFFVIRAELEKVLPKYLAWWLNLKKTQQYINQNIEGSTTKSIRLPVLADLKIKIPDLAKQQSIVQIVNTLEQEKQIVFKLIENNELLLNAIAQDLI